MCLTRLLPNPQDLEPCYSLPGEENTADSASVSLSATAPTCVARGFRWAQFSTHGPLLGEVLAATLKCTCSDPGDITAVLKRQVEGGELTSAVRSRWPGCGIAFRSLKGHDPSNSAIVSLCLLTSLSPTRMQALNIFCPLVSEGLVVCGLLSTSPWRRRPVDVHRSTTPVFFAPLS